MPDSAGIFHPKLYFFDNGRTADIFIGSSNLTGRAFSQNAECVVQLSVSTSDPLAQTCKRIFKAWESTSSGSNVAVDLYSEYAKRLKEIEEIRTRYEQALRSPRPTNSNPFHLNPSAPHQVLPQDLVAVLVSKGFICDTNFSAASFRVSIPSDLAGVTAPPKTSTAKIPDNKVKMASRLITVDRRLIHWELLSEEQQREIQKLRYSVGFGPQEYGFRTPWGFFVPETKFPHWLSWVKHTDEEIQLFMKKAVQSILRRETTINQEFKQEFSKRFPKAPKVKVNAAASIVKQHLVELRQVYKHERIFRPTWYPAILFPTSQWLNTLDDASLSQYAGTMADEVFTRNLADFARVACKQARSATQGLKPGAAKKTCEETIDRVRMWNFYKDKDLERWCQELERVIKLMPATPSRLSKERLKERREKVAYRIEKLNEDALKMMREVEGWRVLPANKALEKFVNVLPQDGDA